MSEVFFSYDPETKLNELVEELYKRLRHSRMLLNQYELASDSLTSNELGYAQGVREEVRYLERLIDIIERS